MDVERNDSLRVRCIETVLGLDDETLLIVDSVLARFATANDRKAAALEAGVEPSSPPPLGAAGACGASSLPAVRMSSRDRASRSNG
jgi:hypothetical protein